MFRGFELDQKGKHPRGGIDRHPENLRHLRRQPPVQERLRPRYGLGNGSSTQRDPSFATSVRRWKRSSEHPPLVLRSVCHRPDPQELRGLRPFTTRWYAAGQPFEESTTKPASRRVHQAGGNLRHLRRTVAPLELHGARRPSCARPTLSDVTRSISILEYYREASGWRRCPPGLFRGAVAGEQDVGRRPPAWLDERTPEHRDSDMGLFIRYSSWTSAWTSTSWWLVILGDGDVLPPGKVPAPHHRRTQRRGLLIARSGVYDGENYHDFNQELVREDVTHSFFRGTGHSTLRGRDPAHRHGGGAGPKASTRGPRRPGYACPAGYIPLEAGPLARQVIAGGPAPNRTRTTPCSSTSSTEIGPSVLVRQLARVHEAPKYYLGAESGSTRSTCTSRSTSSRSSTPTAGVRVHRAARGALSDWIVIEDGKIANYQVITPTAWNIGPRDRDGCPARSRRRWSAPRQGPGGPGRARPTSPAASTPAWCAPCTPTTAGPGAS